MMLQSVTSRTRLELISARIKAHKGHIEDSLSCLATLAGDPAIQLLPIDALAVRLLKAEILYLDERDQEAFDELKDIAASLSEATSPEVELSIRRNLVNVGTTLFDADSLRDFYALVDEQRLAGVNLRDTTAVLDAKESASDGKHYDTLPALWAEHERTFRQGCWPIWRWAASNLADECIQVGFFVDAAIFAIYALDGRTAEKVGELLLMRGNELEIKKVLMWITDHALLWRHYTVACALIAKVADAIQSEEIEPVFQWILRGCMRSAESGFEQARVVKAWECAEAIAPLLRDSEASTLCQVAMSHRMWKKFSVHRSTLRDAVGPCVPLLPVEQVTSLVDNLIEQVSLPSKTEDDIISTVNLLAFAVDRCDDATKTRVATTLFPKGKGLPWPLVMAAPKLLAGKVLQVNWDKSFEILLNDLRHEVQHLTEGEAPTPVSSSVMQYHENLPNGDQRLIHILSLVSVQAALEHRSQIPDEKWNPLIDAMLDGVANPFNLLTNRIQHVKLLGRAAEHLNEEQIDKIFAVLAPISRGRIKTNLDEMSEEEANHPLNRFRIHGGTPADLQAIAIQTLAMIEKAYPKSYGRKLNQIITDGLMSSHRVIRQLALWAWAEAPGRASIPGLLVLLSTRDPNAQVAAAAIEAFGATNGHSLSMKEFNGLIDSCRTAASSQNPRLRTAAAYCLRQVRKNLPGQQLQKLADNLLESLENDICFSVRRQFKPE